METLSWDDLRVLLAVHCTGSLLAAGRLLGFSTSTTARRLDALEAAVGYPLVTRGKSGSGLEPAAMALVRLAQEMESGLARASRDQHGLAGTLRISVPDGMADMLAAPLIALHQAHPGIHIELVGENQLVDVAAREADIAVRLRRSTSNVLVEKHLATLRFSLYASTDYQRAALPDRKLDRQAASRHAFIGLDPRWKGLAHEQWLAKLGATRFVFRSSSIDAIVAAVRAGAGMAALLDDDPRTAGLERIETESPGPSQSFYLVYHRDLRAQAHVRAAVKAIEASMRPA